MSSAHIVFPSSLIENRGLQAGHTSRSMFLAETQPQPEQQKQALAQATTPIRTNHLSPYSAVQHRSFSASPTLNEHTPTESIHYQSSDYTDIGDDPFFGIDFGAAEGGSPSFLDFGPLPFSGGVHQTEPSPSYPLSPKPTPFLNRHSSQQPDRDRNSSAEDGRSADSLFPQVPSGHADALGTALNSSQSAYQNTPETSGSGCSSGDGLASAPSLSAMPFQASRATDPQQALTDEQDGSASNDQALEGSEQSGAGPLFLRDEEVGRMQDRSARPRGLDPESRPRIEVPASINDMAARRRVEGKNKEVQEWLTVRTDSGFPGDMASPTQTMRADDVTTAELVSIQRTENRLLPGHVYIQETGHGQLTATDVAIMRESRHPWADGPLLPRIQGGRPYQPPTSQAAIDKFERMCKDTDSVVSRAATWGTTWGTRRLSLPSELDVEGVTSGSFLKKLSISRGEGGRRPSILKGVQNLLKKPGPAPKRGRTPEDDSGDVSEDRTEGRDSLATPTRTLSGSHGGKKQSVPSINTALVSVTNSAAAIGTSHVRSGSISATPLTSPRSPNTLSLGGMKAMIRHSRSGSELAAMWKRAGGPPVAKLAKTPPNQTAAEQDDEEDEDEVYVEDPVERRERGRIAEAIEPTVAGFAKHILQLNPSLARTNDYLVERLAQQQLARYKRLLKARTDHLKSTSLSTCPNGVLCMAQGGSARSFEPSGDSRSLEPRSALADSSDGDVGPTEGLISPESFPPGIPMPPAKLLPAEFECPICFASKKIQKPSDWTKHVHEDVQPFTCTWGSCKEIRTFKRKADWVRHENEGHRHLEWWECDIEGCQHVCYRRDNFLQHLVREHKFDDPPEKTKAAIKRAGAVHPTWRRVESCHREKEGSAQEEPCRFCGKALGTWKKLTVHLAKHMEQISLPVIRLVEKAEVNLDTVISPIHERPSQAQPFHAVPGNALATGFSILPSSAPRAALVNQPPGAEKQPPTYAISPAMEYAYGAVQPSPLQQGAFRQPFSATGHFGAFGHGFEQTRANMPFPQSFGGTSAGDYDNLPAATETVMPNPNAFVQADTTGLEPFPALPSNPLGLSGLQVPGDGQQQYSYDDAIDSLSAGPDRYPSQGSVSPFADSPHQGQGGLFGLF
ncbi:hypothetical protein VTK73DRAFT_5735 [Phialemonium thermophilum]|uniref:C2H2-type domain-containing protein n=1 Tax=Phialemonium thermophilum TaxID=223376 RepID=A0ABR3XXZ6_9PEZI